MAVFTLEDEQIIWMDKSSDVQRGQTNGLTFGRLEKRFFKMICPSR